jgi:hypothetical protein
LIDRERNDGTLAWAKLYAFGEEVVKSASAKADFCTDQAAERPY